MMKKHLRTITLTLLIFGCAGSEQEESVNVAHEATTEDVLSEEEALRILNEEYRGEQCSGDIWNKGSKGNDDYQENTGRLIDLENQGLIKMQYKNYGETNESVSFSITGEGAERYEHNTYRTAITEERPQEIVGMSKVDERTTIVAFRVKVEATPFYVLASEYGETKCPLGGTNEREVTFVKYDTGWRIQKND